LWQAAVDHSLRFADLKYEKTALGGVASLISSSVYEEVVPDLKMDSSLSTGSISEWVPNEVFSTRTL